MGGKKLPLTQQKLVFCHTFVFSLYHKRDVWVTHSKKMINRPKNVVQSNMSDSCPLYVSTPKRNIFRTIKHELTEKLTQQETKTCPASSQPQNTSRLKAQTASWLPAFLCRVILADKCLLSDSEVPKGKKTATRPECSESVMEKTFCFWLCSVCGVEEVWRVETEGGVRNTKPLGGMSGRSGSSHVQCAFSREKKRVYLINNGQVATVKPR